MTKVATIVNDALGLLRVIDSNEAPEAEDVATAIRALNLMMRKWEVDGLAFGWSDVAAPTQDIPIPQDAEEAVTYNLALRLRARYGAALEEDVVAIARSGLATLSAQMEASSFSRLTYPDLPVGVRGRCDGEDGFNH